MRLRWIYSLCFLLGAITHASDFAHGGLRPYAQFGPPLLEAFWSSLLVLDVVAAALMMTRTKQRAGIALSIVIMTLDVSANAYALVVLRHGAFVYSLPLQTLFFGFVLGSAPFLWRES